MRIVTGEGLYGADDCVGNNSRLEVWAVSRCCRKLKTAEAFQHQLFVLQSGFRRCFLKAALFYDAGPLLATLVLRVPDFQDLHEVKPTR